MTSKGAHLMNQSDDLEYQLDTLAIRTGHTRSFEGEHGEPIFLTSSFKTQVKILMWRAISLMPFCP